MTTVIRLLLIACDWLIAALLAIVILIDLTGGAEFDLAGHAVRAHSTGNLLVRPVCPHGSGSTAIVASTRWRDAVRGGAA